MKSFITTFVGVIIPFIKYSILGGFLWAFFYTIFVCVRDFYNRMVRLENKMIDLINYIEKVEEDIVVEAKEELPIKASSVCYGDKKKLSILYTREMVKQDQPDFLAYFESNHKKDDLADSFLQGYYVLSQKEIQQQIKIKKQEEKKNQPKKPRKSKKKNVLEQLNDEEVPKPKGKKKEVVEETVKKPVTRGRKKKVEEVKKEDFHYLHDSSDEEK